MDSDEEYSQKKLENCSYRSLQQIAKAMSLPSNVKKIYLIQLIHAKKHLSEADVEFLVRQVRQERQQTSVVRKKANKPQAKKITVQQSTEISSTSNNSPSITPTPKRTSHFLVRYSPEYRPSRCSRTFQRSAAQPRNNSDRVLRSFNVVKRPSYFINNNTVIGVIKTSTSQGRKETKVILNSEEKYHKLGVRTHVARKVEHSRSELIPGTRSLNISPPITKRQRTISGIYPLTPTDIKIPNVIVRRPDGRLSKINAIIQKPVTQHYKYDVTTQPNYNYDVTTQPNYNYNANTRALTQHNYNYNVSTNALTQLNYNYDVTNALTKPNYNYVTNALTKPNYNYDVSTSAQKKHNNIYDLISNALTQPNSSYDGSTSVSMQSNNKFDVSSSVSKPNYSYDVSTSILTQPNYNYAVTASVTVESKTASLPELVGITDAIQNELENGSQYFHKKIRAEHMRAKSRDVAEERLPHITDVFSKFNAVYCKDLMQPIYVQVSSESEIGDNIPYPPHYQAVTANTSMLEKMYNLKNVFLVNQPLLQICTTSNTKCVYSTPVITTAKPQPPINTANNEYNIVSEPHNSQCDMELSTMPRVHDFFKNFTCTEDMSLSSSSAETMQSQELGANVTIPEMVEDALELISQDGDYMERMGMDIRMQCILCQWAGPKIILEYHIRKEHSPEVMKQDRTEWCTSYSVGELSREPLWRSQVSERESQLYVVSAKYDQPDSFMATLTTLSSEEDTPKIGRITAYNKMTGEPFTWEGEIQQLPPSLPYENTTNCLKVELSRLNLLPNSANLKLLNGELVMNSAHKVVIGQTTLDNINIVLTVKLLN